MCDNCSKCGDKMKLYTCVQCGCTFVDYKMMADEKTCGQCEHQTREFSKVDLKRLFKTMPEADVDDVMREVSDEQYRKDMSDMIDDCITHWKKQKDTNMDNLRDDILDLITN